MPGTYAHISIQIVFAVRFRKALISPAWEADLYKYITGIVKNNGQNLIAINGMPDHIHIFLGLRPECHLPSLVREIKKSSNNFINKNNLTGERFYWQNGYGAFSYGRSQMMTVVNYIENQKTIHLRRSLREEFIELLTRFEVEYKSDYLFELVE
ncbi:MAG: IS200/IS605 family transposase [Bacteroidetes bacterium]|nr:MAG: IS200/IS605 family transposase [Bacteroidota bacterium]